MSPERKLVKVLSLLFIVWGLMAAVHAAFVIWEADDSGWSLPNILIVVGALVQVFLGFFLSYTGVQGSNTPSKISPFNVACIGVGLFEIVYLVLHDLIAHFFNTPELYIGFWGVLISAIALVMVVLGYIFGRKVYNASLK